MQEKYHQENKNLLINNPELNEEYKTLFLKGVNCFYGINVPINYKEAFEIFDKINIELNYHNNEVLIFLGIMYEKGFHVKKSYRKAVEFYKKASKNGSGKAFFLLAKLAENKILDDEDSNNAYDDVAFNYYTKSAKLGYSDAFARIGVILEQGLLNTVINLKEAFQNFERSVQINNNPAGLNGKGNAFYNGIVVEQNYPQAVEYYRLAIRGGNIDALNNLGICFEYGKGVEQNNDKALDFYSQAKNKGHGDAMANYAILKIKIAIKNNNYSCFSECFKILQSAILINKNNPEIYYYIGLIYEIGIDLFEDGNVIKNPYLAFLNYKKSAELDYPKAYTKIGISLFNGIEGVFLHNEKASISMLEKAVEKGDDEAKKFLDYVKSLIKE